MSQNIGARSVWIGAVCCSLFAALVHADNLFHFDIAAGDLTVALEALAKQTGIEVVYETAQLKGLRTRGVSGDFSPSDAIARILKGTTLRVRQDSSGAILISEPTGEPSGAEPNHRGKAATTGATSAPAGEAPVPQTAALSSTGAATRGSEQAQTEKADSRTTELDEVTVTARNRKERLIDVPVSATSISQQEIARYAISSFAGIAEQTPQLVIGAASSGAAAVINLRGIGAGDSGSATDQPVSIAIDHIEISQANVLALGQYDLERVDVLKGPQTVFFGKNSPAGVISMISKDPGPDFESQLRTGYEFYNQQRYIEAIASGPVGEGFGARLVGYFSGQDGWFENSAVPLAGLVSGTDPARSQYQTEKFGRLTLTYDSPDKRFDARLKFSYGDVDRKNGFTAEAQNFACGAGTPQFDISVTECQPNRYFQNANIAPAIIASSPEGYFQDGKPHTDTSQYLVSYEMNYALSDQIKLTSVTGAYGLHEDLLDSITPSELSLVGFRADIHNHQITEELRLASSLQGPIDFQVGGYFENRSSSEWDPVGFGAGLFAPYAVVIPITNSLDRTRAFSGFAEVMYQIAPKFQLALGERYSHEEKSLGGTVGGGTFQAPVVELASTAADPNRVFTNLSPEITLTYKPAADLTAYASFREGFVSGGYNDATAAGANGQKYDASFGQSTAKGGEMGLKGYLLDRQLRFDLTGYYYKYDGLQVTSFDPVTASGRTTNAASATIRGVEDNLFFAPAAINGLDLRLGFGFNQATYGNFLTSGCYGGQTIAEGCNGFLENGAYSTQNLSGRPLARAPKWTINSGFSYDHDVNERLTGSFSFDAAFVGKYYDLPEEDPRSLQAGFWTLNGALSLRGANKGWELSLIGRNLANKLAVVSSFDSILTGAGTGTPKGTLSDLVGSLNAPRTVVLQLTVRNAFWAR